MRSASWAALAGAIALAGCGGGSSSSSTSSLSTVKQPEKETTTSSPSTTTTPRTASTSSSPAKPPSGGALPDNASPTQTVRAALTSTDSAVCEVYTPALLEKSFGGVQGCRSSIRSGGRAGSVEIVKSTSKGRDALVVAVPHGGPSSAEKLQITLVRSGKRWQLQSIKSNVPVGP